MKRQNPDDSRRGPQEEERSSGTNSRLSNNSRAPSSEGRRTEVKNANAAGLGAIGREEGKLSDAANRSLGEMENEDIY